MRRQMCTYKKTKNGVKKRVKQCTNDVYCDFSNNAEKKVFLPEGVLRHTHLLTHYKGKKTADSQASGAFRVIG
jgi:hypothetical protein